jgi:predicted alpha/beta-hydrolase family hydrolase
MPLENGPSEAELSLILAHGAGQGPESEFMERLALHLAAGGVRVVRPWFPYMAKTASDGRRRPPDREPRLLEALREIIVAEQARTPRVFCGGKSMGGRIAAMLADEFGIAGLVCFGYPFHPTGRPTQTRLAALEAIETPTLICQGERDPFGTRAEVDGYDLSPAVRIGWVADGEHSFKPRKSSGRDWGQNMDEAADLALAFIMHTAEFVGDEPVMRLDAVRMR